MKKIWFDEAWEDYTYWKAKGNKAAHPYRKGCAAA
jgi:hypothetical protein